MTEQTMNYQLVKPDPEEFYDVAVPNGNMDKIDAALKALSDALGGIDLVTLSQAIATVDNRVTEHLDDYNKKLPTLLSAVNLEYNTDPNTTLKPTILTSHVNNPASGFWYIITLAYSGDGTIKESDNKAQIAVRYNSVGFATRRYFNGTWSAWDIYATSEELEEHTSKSASSAHGKVRKEYRLYDGLLSTGSVTLPSTPYSSLVSYDEILIFGAVGRTVAGSANIKHFTEVVKPLSNVATYKVSINHTILSPDNANETKFHFHMNLVNSTRVLTIDRNAYKVNSGNSIDNGLEGLIFSVIGVKYD